MRLPRFLRRLLYPQDYGAETAAPHPESEPAHPADSVRPSMELPVSGPPEPGVRYFLTIATLGRKPWLAVPRTRDVFLAVLRSWQEERNGRILAATLLPDHAHVLLQLGSLLTVDQVVTRWRVTTRRGTGFEETFEEKFRRQRVATGSETEEFALYMFLHPYRDRLVAPSESWPGWYAPDPQAFAFSSALDPTGGPPMEWVLWPESRFAALAHGE